MQIKTIQQQNYNVLINILYFSKLNIIIDLFFLLRIALKSTMEKSTLSKIYEWASYVLIIGATVYFFVNHKEPLLTLVIIMLALFCRNFMYRTRYKMFEEENEELKVDLRRLTNLLEVEKKKNGATPSSSSNDK